MKPMASGSANRKSQDCPVPMRRSCRMRNKAKALQLAHRGSKKATIGLHLPHNSLAVIDEEIADSSSTLSTMNTSTYEDSDIETMRKDSGNEEDDSDFSSALIDVIEQHKKKHRVTKLHSKIPRSSRMETTNASSSSLIHKNLQSVNFSTILPVSTFDITSSATDSETTVKNTRSLAPVLISSTPVDAVLNAEPAALEFSTTDMYVSNTTYANEPNGHPQSDEWCIPIIPDGMEMCSIQRMPVQVRKPSSFRVLKDPSEYFPFINYL